MSQPSVKRPALVLFALWALNFATSAQFLIVTPLLPEIRDQLTVDENLLGLLVTVYAIGVGVFSLIAGPVSDRYGRRIILIVGSIGMSVALLLHGFAVTFPLLLLGRLIAGSMAGLLAGASVSYVGDAFPFSQRGRANGVLASAFAAGQILGIPVGAMLGEIAYRLPFTSFGVGVGLAAILILLFVPQPPVKLTERLSLVDAVRGYGALLVRLDTAAAVAAYTVMFLGVSLFITYLPTWLTHLFDVSPTSVSTLFMVGGIANLLVAPFAGALSDRIGKKIMIVGGSATMGLLMAATPWVVQEFWFAYIMFFVVMVFVAVRISPMQALVSSLVGARQRGSLVALCFAIGQVGFGGGSAIAGPLYEHYGFEAAAVAGGLSAAGMALVVGLFIREPRGDRDEDGEAVPASA